MYLDFHKFREKPFNLTPDPRFIFLSKNHKEAFAHILYGIKNRVGFIALTGEVGSGKTTVLRTLLCQLDADHYRTALIFNPSLSSAELLKNINREFGITDKNSNDSSLLDPLNRFLLKQNAEGRTVVLVIDEAQNLETQVLEQIRLISNLETDREKLIQIILSGQPELIQILNKEELRQLSQRITVRYHLQPMDFQDTVEYINHRIRVAGGRDKEIFTKRALKKIYAFSKGLPRLVNAACDRILLTGYARDTKKISSRIAGAGLRDIKKNMVAKPLIILGRYVSLVAVKDIEKHMTPNTKKKIFVLIPAAVIIAGLIAGSIHYKWDQIANKISPYKKIVALKFDASGHRVGGKSSTVNTFDQIKNRPLSSPQATEHAREVAVQPAANPAPAVTTGEKLFNAMAAELGGISEAQSNRKAFNNLAVIWNVSTIPENSQGNQLNDIEGAASNRKLRVYRFSGNLGTLLRLNHPSALELTLPGIKGKRYITLVGMENEQILVEPQIAGRKSLSFRELEKYWSGQGYLLWKDFSNIMTKVSAKQEKNRIMRLQDLLKEAGVYHKPSTGIYDNDTMLAVKEFQLSKGFTQDGIAGSQTTMLLYRSIDRFPVPGLSGRRK